MVMRDGSACMKAPREEMYSSDGNPTLKPYIMSLSELYAKV